MKQVRIWMEPDLAIFLTGRKDVHERIRDRQLVTKKRGAETLCALQIRPKVMERFAAQMMMAD